MKELGTNNNIFIGFTFEEKKRANAQFYKKSKNKYHFPLIDWKITDEDCKRYLIQKNLKYPLNNFKRTGCWLCPKQNLDSLRVLYKKYPELWNKLKKLEKDSPHGFKPNFSLEKFEQKITEESKQLKLKY